MPQKKAPHRGVPLARSGEDEGWCEELNAFAPGAKKWEFKSHKMGAIYSLVSGDESVKEFRIKSGALTSRRCTRA